MLSDKLKNKLHLHFLVFVAGFTAILGELISIKAIPLVWFRMVIAGLLIFIYIKLAKIKTKVSRSAILKFFFAGIIIALHWITFFGAINESNVSIALAMFSTGAFFASIIEPLFYKRKIIKYEIIFGLLVVFGIFLIMESEIQYLNGIILGISSAFFSSFFAVLNGKFVQKYNATVISFYEFIGGVLFISIYLLFSNNGFSYDFFIMNAIDWMYILILASICTAYAFIGAVHVMKYISPFTVVLTYNLEPVYGIILALIIFGEKEIMSSNFYYGAVIILSTVLLDSFIKRHANKFKFKS
jgi:drug/metabolite transporter (DMT)-like permease